MRARVPVDVKSARVGGGVERRLSQQPRDRVDGLRPERADPPFVALAVQAHPRLRPQVEMLDAQVGDLLHAGAGVVEQEEEGAITQGVSSVCG